MSSVGGHKIEDLILNLTNFQCFIAKQMAETFERQSTAIEGIESQLKILVNSKQQEERQVAVKVTAADSGVSCDHAPTPISRVLPPEPQPSITHESPENECPVDEKYEIYCHDCKATFVRGTGHFTRHVKFTSCRPYKCYCGKLFKKKSSLTAHKATHSTKIFNCKLCPAFFRCDQYLRNHMRRMHSVKSEVVKSSENVDQKMELSNDQNNFDHPLQLLSLQMQ